MQQLYQERDGTEHAPTETIHYTLIKQMQQIHKHKQTQHYTLSTIHQWLHHTTESK